MTRTAPTTAMRRMREAAGLSLRQLEKLTGINRGSLSRIERGWDATPAEAEAILAALRKSGDEGGKAA